MLIFIYFLEVMRNTTQHLAALTDGFFERRIASDDDSRFRAAGGSPPVDHPWRTEARHHVDAGDSQRRRNMLAGGIVADIQIAFTNQRRKQTDTPAPDQKLRLR